MVFPSLITSSVVYASLFGLMALGLTLTYITTKVPNFAYGSFVGIGIYTAYSLFRIQKITPYYGSFAAFVLAGLSSLIMYLIVLRPLARRGVGLVSLMIATFAIDIALTGIFGIYTDYITNRYKLGDAKSFYPLQADFSMLGVSGVVIISPLTLAIISISLYLLLKKTKFGTAMRATVENPSLAKILGVNVDAVYMFSWIIAGGLAGIAGSLYTLWLPGGVSSGSDLIVEIFAASILGGISSIFGAVFGGLIIGASEISLTNYLAQGFGFLGALVISLLIFIAGLALLMRKRLRVRLFGMAVFIIGALLTADILLGIQSFPLAEQLISGFGPDVIPYQKGIPLMIMVITLLLLPRGLSSIEWGRIIRRRRTRRT
jgi:branched-chain amino acid transport system permease protein